MEIQSLVSLVILCSFAALSRGQKGFLSIDCGSREERYTDDRGIQFLRDEAYLEQDSSGDTANVSSGLSTPDLEKPLRNLRFFREGRRNCYALPVRKGLNVPYLTRAYFYYGNYDGKEELPVFDLYLGIYKWATINVTKLNETVIKEIVHFPSTDEITICLVNTAEGIPFISALELRSLPDEAYKSNYEYLKLFNRIDFGSTEKNAIRYPDDPFDRRWNPSSSKARKLDSSEVDTLSGGNYTLPSKVMKTAVTPTNANTTFLSFNWSPEIKDCIFFIHIAEVEDITGGREFTISGNDVPLDSVESPKRLEAPFTWKNFVSFREPNLTVVLNQTQQAENPPILNAVEIFMVENVTERSTKQQEVDAMKEIRKYYEIKDISWQGDPCAPSFRKSWWSGARCDSDSPTILALNLSSSRLQGRIHSSLVNLSNVRVLDLSNNLLDGGIPSFLSEMPSLRVLNISGNNLKGEIPQQLIEKSDNRTLDFSYDGNSGLCTPGSCKKKSSIVPIIAAVGAVVALVVLMLLIWLIWKLRRRPAGQPETAIEPPLSSMRDTGDISAPFGKNNRRFTYSEIERITTNFDRTLGRGGFGIVYYGKLEDETEVAVKVLSANSLQGSEEFRAEASLLMTVHHKNLTSLVGYCDEGTKMGLIYEYMPNGNLQRLLKDNRVDALSWDERFRIAIDAAQGLEYLHNGIRPPVIHRDIKTSNILLDQNFNAKLADFGLSKAFELEADTGGISTQIRGTPGYLDPEYYISKRLTKKSDIYSFGVVILELITGKSAITRGNAENMHISEWVKKEMERGGISSVVDPRLNGTYNQLAAQKAVDIGLACASTDASVRPDVSDMVAELKECLKMEVARLNSRYTESGEESSGGVLSTGDFKSVLMGR